MDVINYGICGPQPVTAIIDFMCWNDNTKLLYWIYLDVRDGRY